MLPYVLSSCITKCDLVVGLTEVLHSLAQEQTRTIMFNAWQTDCSGWHAYLERWSWRNWRRHHEVDSLIFALGERLDSLESLIKKKAHPKKKLKAKKAATKPAKKRAKGGKKATTKPAAAKPAKGGKKATKKPAAAKRKAARRPRPQRRRSLARKSP